LGVDKDETEHETEHEHEAAKGLLFPPGGDGGGDGGGGGGGGGGNGNGNGGGDDDSEDTAEPLGALRTLESLGLGDGAELLALVDEDGMLPPHHTTDAPSEQGKDTQQAGGRKGKAERKKAVEIKKAEARARRRILARPWR
jgi:hypothetical protein